MPRQLVAASEVVQIVLAPGAKLMGGALSPGRNVLGIVKELQERLEKGQAIEKRA